MPIFGHCYDLPIPNGVAPLCAGPWLKPSRDFSGYAGDPVTAWAIVQQALQAFRAMLLELATAPENNFFLVETRGTLSDTDWANELHPHPDGFLTLANKFRDRLRLAFPGRI